MVKWKFIRSLKSSFEKYYVELSLGNSLLDYWEYVSRLEFWEDFID